MTQKPYQNLHGDLTSIASQLRWGEDLLFEQGIADAALSARLILAYVLAKPSSFLLARPETSLVPQELLSFKALMIRRSKHEPIAYLLGEKEFYGLPFNVSPDVLIPRPETELIIDLVRQKCHDQAQSLSVIDIGTGSGAIAVTVKKHCPWLELTAIDICTKALKVAQDNAKKHEVKIQWVQSDLLEQVDGRFDILLANLPYVSVEAMSDLSQEVLYEPKLALDGGSQGLVLYARLLEQAKAKLSSGADLFFEIGWDQREVLQKLCSIHPYTCIQVYKDLQGHDRVVHLRKG